MEDDSTNLVEQCALEMDQMLEGVMPDTWMGHARIIVAGKNLNDEQKAKVLKVTEKMVEEKNVPADEMAKVCIEKVQ